jgi:hypothetical protein
MTADGSHAIEVRAGTPPRAATGRAAVGGMTAAAAALGGSSSAGLVPGTSLIAAVGGAVIDSTAGRQDLSSPCSRSGQSRSVMIVVVAPRSRVLGSSRSATGSPQRASPSLGRRSPPR